MMERFRRTLLDLGCGLCVVDSKVADILIVAAIKVRSLSSLRPQFSVFVGAHVRDMWPPSGPIRRPCDSPCFLNSSAQQTIREKHWRNLQFELQRGCGG